MTEFKDIPGYERYQINLQGDVWDKLNHRFMKISVYYGCKFCYPNGIKKAINKLINMAFEKPRPMDLEPLKKFPNYLISKNGQVYNLFTSLENEGHIDKKGYIRINVGNGKILGLHRLLAMQYLPNPDNKPHIDHIDGNPSNNTLENLRWVTAQENTTNRKIPKTNTSGYRGITVSKDRYKGQLQKDGIKYSIICPLTEEGLNKAIEWRRLKEIELFGEFRRKA